MIDQETTTATAKFGVYQLNGQPYITGTPHPKDLVVISMYHWCSLIYDLGPFPKKGAIYRL